MAQTGDSLRTHLKSAGAHAFTAEACAAAANAARRGGGGAKGGQSQFQDFTSGLSEADKGLFPDPKVVEMLGAQPAAMSSQEPVKIHLPGQSGGRGGGGNFSPDAQSFTPSGSSAAAPDHKMPQDAGNPYMHPMMNPMMMNPMMNPMMMGMPGFGAPYMDPNMMAAMGGKGGMPWMMPGMMPGMFPGMSPQFGGGYGGMPQAGGGGKKGGAGIRNHGGGGGGGGDGEGKEKATRERRRRKNKNSRASEEAPENDETAANRSEELNEVRKLGGGKTTKYTLEQVLPQAIEFATDQHGSRFLQNKLDEDSTTAAEKKALFEAILPHTKAMSKDQFGNFVVQKLFDMTTADQKRQLADQLEGEVMALSSDQHGCRVIQKALQLLPRDAQTKLAMELENKVDECIQNMHGNHVIQKCIEQMPPDSVNFIINAVSERVEFHAEHMYGCRVIQRLLEHCAPHQLQEMLKKIEAHTWNLAQNPYGNYVVQHMLEHGRPEDKKTILNCVADHIMDFAKNKQSSNVVEKCFEIATIGEHADALKDDRAKLFAAVLEPKAGELPTPLQQLTDDRFGNYIVQRMLEHSRGEERESLKRQLLQCQEQLKTSTNGKHILSALNKEFGIPMPPTEES